MVPCSAAFGTEVLSDMSCTETLPAPPPPPVPWAEVVSAQAKESTSIHFACPVPLASFSPAATTSPGAVSSVLLAPPPGLWPPRLQEVTLIQFLWSLCCSATFGSNANSSGAVSPAALQTSLPQL